jgi:uncharacterized membrane protein YbaN (DUF454 family)
MGIVDEKVLAATIIAVLYAVSWFMKPQTVLKVILNTIFLIVSIIWVLDFFGLYPLSKIVRLNFYS